MELDNYIRFYRTQLGLTQPELAHKVGSSNSVIFRAENNMIDPKISLIIRLSKFFGVPVEELCFPKGENPPKRLIVD